MLELGSVGFIFSLNFSFLLLVWVENRVWMLFNSCGSFIWVGDIFSLLVLILDMLRMLLSRRVRVFFDVWIMWVCFFSFGFFRLDFRVCVSL